MILTKEQQNIQPLEEGNIKRPPMGGYICKVLAAYDTVSKSGKNMLILFLDIDEGEYKGAYASKMNVFNSETVKGIPYYQIVDGEKSIAYYLGMIKAFEKSNAGFKFNHEDANNTASLVGKRVGFIFGEEESYYNGKYYYNAKPKWARSVETIKSGNYTLPPALERKESETTVSTASTLGVMPATEDISDDAWNLPMPQQDDGVPF